MRLVIDGRRLTAARTGVGRYLEVLLGEWTESGLPLADVLVVLKDRAGLDGVPAVPGLRAEVVGSGWPGLAWERLGLGRRLQTDDLLFAPTNLVPSTWFGPTALVLFDLIPEVLPDGFPRHVRWRFNARYRRAARRADLVIVPSRATARDAGRLYGVADDRLRVIPPGLDPGFRPRPLDAPEVVAARKASGVDDAPYFLFVGKRSRRRNIPELLGAFNIHINNYKDHRLLFVGPEGGTAVFGERVLSVGHVGEATLHALMSGALALLYPSDYEGFGLPVLEALASGCPVLTLRNSALVEAGGEAPYYLDDAKVESLVHALARITDHPGERASRIKAGLAHAAMFHRSRFADAVKAELVALGRARSDDRSQGGQTLTRSGAADSS